MRWPTPVVVLAVLAALVVATAGAAWAGAEEGEKVVVVRKGDTLSVLAKRHGVTVADLRKWNRGKLGRKDVVRVGMKLVVRPGDGEPEAPKIKGAPANTWADSVTVRRGESAGRIAEREGVALTDLLTWNGLTARSKLHAGQHLLVLRPGPRPRALSVGRPTEGSLKFGEKLAEGIGYRLRFPKHTFALESVNKTLRACVKRTRDAFPGTVDVLIGELSRAGGGHFPPHQSHQSGRDADIGYYLAKNVQNETMHRVRPTEVDFGKSWALLKCLLTTDKVSRVYMDKAIQAAMAEWLRQKKTMTEDELGRIFGVLGGDASLVRHAVKHDTHFHVRFSCDADQPECVEEEDESPFTL